MRRWFHKHPNVPVVLLGLLWLVSVLSAEDHILNHQWGWAVVNLVAMLSASRWFMFWWRRT